jgi:DNA invertase Pin-like site-specific DNA recombinase
MVKASGSKVAYSYVRFSSPEQAKGDSLNRQTARAQEYAKANGLILDTSLNLRDLGVSAYRGKNATEGALGAFLQVIKEGHVRDGSTLIVESLDRLSRDQITTALGQFLSIIGAGVTIVTLVDGMKYSQKEINANPTSLIVSLTIMMRAHDESRTKADRVGSAWRSKRDKAAAGEIMTSRAPAWLRLIKAKNGGKSWEVIPERKKLLNRIFTLSTKGNGRRSIAIALNREGIEPWGDGEGMARKADGWHDSYIAKILRNPAVIGTYQPHWINPATRKREPKGDPIEGYFPSVIPMDLWNKSQLRSRPPAGPRVDHVLNLFPGLVIDGYTGKKMKFLNKRSSKNPRKSGKGGLYLQSDVHRLGKSKVQQWSYPEFERLVMNTLRELDWSNILEGTGSDELKRLNEQAQELKLKKKKLEAGLDQLINTLAEGPSTLVEKLQEKARSVGAELEQVASALDSTNRQIRAEEGISSTLEGEIKEFKRQVQKGDVDSRRWLQAVIKQRILSITAWKDGKCPDPKYKGPQDGKILKVCFWNRVTHWVYSTSTSWP